MLRYYPFDKDFNKVQHNLIKRTPKTYLFHFASGDRAKLIFNIADLCAVEVYLINNNNNNNKVPYSCCGKVIIMNLDNDREIIGYILEETNTQWKIQLMDYRIVFMLVPTYYTLLFVYLFPKLIIYHICDCSRFV